MAILLAKDRQRRGRVRTQLNLVSCDNHVPVTPESRRCRCQILVKGGVAEKRSDNVELLTARTVAKAWESTNTSSGTTKDHRDHGERQYPSEAVPPLQELWTCYGSSLGASIHLLRSYGGQIFRFLDGRNEHFRTRR